MDEDYAFLSIEFIKNIYKKQNLEINKVIRFLFKNLILFLLLLFVYNHLET